MTSTIRLNFGPYEGCNVPTLDRRCPSVRTRRNIEIFFKYVRNKKMTTGTLHGIKIERLLNVARRLAVWVDELFWMLRRCRLPILKTAFGQCEEIIVIFL